MERNSFALIGGDTRQVMLADLLVADGHRVSTFAIAPPCPDPSPALSTVVADANNIILPLPVTRDGDSVHTPLWDGHVSLDELFSVLRPDQFVCGGMLSDTLSHRAKTRGIHLFDYYSREELVTSGAIATAEGAVQLAMEKTARTLSGSRVLIIGFGRIGKILARLLQSFGAQITVTARKPADFVLIRAAGHTAVHTQELGCNLANIDIVLNTVPHLVVDADRLAQLRRDVLCIDLASPPGGIDFAAAKKLGISTIHALSLPGKVAPLSFATALRDTIYQMLKEEISK